MHNIKIFPLLKKSKENKHMTMNDIAKKTSGGIRTVNRVFAGEEVRFSTLVAILETLDLDIYIDKKRA